MCSQGNCKRPPRPGMKMCQPCAEKCAARNRRYRDNTYVSIDDVPPVIYCLRCRSLLVESVTEVPNARPALNTHSWACSVRGCGPEPQLTVTLPARLGQCEDSLTKRIADWDEPLGELDWDALKGAGSYD